MSKFAKRLKKLGKKALIRLNKHHRREICTLYECINELNDDHEKLERRVNIACDEATILRRQLTASDALKPVPTRNKEDS